MSLEKQPKVSIIMGVYNCEKTLDRCIDSLLKQTYKNWELIMCDDCSQDNTLKLATEYTNKYENIKVVKNKQNSGLAFSLNQCLSVATGKYIARMDADDIMFDDRLYKQVKYMDSNPECFVCGGQMEYIGGLTGMAPILPQKYEDLLYLSLINCPLYHPTTIIRNSAIKQFGLKYNDSYKHAEDYKFWSDIIFSHPNSIANIKDVVLFYRISIKSSNSTGSIANLRLPPVPGIPYKAANIPLTQSHMFPCGIIKVNNH